jgi:hypothetical protein
MIKKRFISMLVLLAAVVTGAWAGAEPPLITILSTGDNASFTSGSKTFDNKATVTFSGEVYGGGEWYSEEERTLTVTAAPGYTITGVKFYNDAGDSGFDYEAPFQAILVFDEDVYENYVTKVNGNSIGTGGVTKIEVYGYATPALNLTSPAVGQVIAADGKNYDYASLPGGIPAVAMICYVSGSNGLALALTDEGQTDWSTAISICAAYGPAFTGGTWKLATQDEWNNMISGAGSFTALRDGFSSVGGTNMQSYYYWSSTEDDSDSGNAWVYGFSDGGWGTSNKDASRKARACLAFDIAPATVAVTGVTLSPTSATLILGETEPLTLSATVAPADATDKSVTWTSSNTSVATVSNEGVVTAVAAGTATITVTATNGTDVTTDDQTATCTVTVAEPTYTVSLKEGTADAAKWQGKAGSGEYQALPLTGLEAGTAVTVKYDGRKRVKSVKAVKKVDPLTVPLTLEALTGGTIVVGIAAPFGSRRMDIMDDIAGARRYVSPGSSKRAPGGSSTISMKYSVNGGEKQAVTSDAITVSEGDKVQLYGNGPDLTNYLVPNIAGGTAQVKAYGNIMSMLDEDNYATLTTLQGYDFYALFSYNTTLTDASGLLLPATTLADACYLAMFGGCTSLTTAPALPATELAEQCYYYMFYDCTSLTTAPALPATTLAEGCYVGMFEGCTSLTTAPALPATELAGSCYSEMFSGCESLTTAPALPATELAEDCYSAMFGDCTSLTTAPVLPATTLVENCYSDMFSGCTNLSSVTCLATDISANYCTGNWLNGVATTGTFTKASGATSWPTGNSGIPSGWTVNEQ